MIRMMLTALTLASILPAVPAAAQTYMYREKIKGVRPAPGPGPYKGQCTAFQAGVGGDYQGTYKTRQVNTTSGQAECTNYQAQSMAWCKTQFAELGLCQTAQQFSGQYCFIYTMAYDRGVQAKPMTSPYYTYFSSSCS